MSKLRRQYNSADFVMNHAPRRAKNSLSRKKFIKRLNRGLSMFVAYGISVKTGRSADSYVDSYVEVYALSLDVNQNKEFVHSIKHHAETKHYHAFSIEGRNFLRDMNVERNRYNWNFVFRTHKAAQKYLDSIK